MWTGGREVRHRASKTTRGGCVASRQSQGKARVREPPKSEGPDDPRQATHASSTFYGSRQGPEGADLKKTLAGRRRDRSSTVLSPLWGRGANGRLGWGRADTKNPRP